MTGAEKAKLGMLTDTLTSQNFFVVSPKKHGTAGGNIILRSTHSPCQSNVLPSDAHALKYIGYSPTFSELH
jgi:hypothetical protein